MTKINQSDKLICISITFVLILLNLITAGMYFTKNLEVEKLTLILHENKVETDYLKFAFEGLLEIENIDTLKQQKEIEIGLFFRKEACHECNEKAILFIKNFFPPKNICLYPNTDDMDYLTGFKVNGLKIKPGQKYDYFKSIDPMFFVVSGDKILLKYTPNKDFPEINKMYMNHLRALIE